MDKRNLEQMGREEVILNKILIGKQTLTRKYVKVIKIQEQSRRKLVFEIDNHVVENIKE